MSENPVLQRSSSVESSHVSFGRDPTSFLVRSGKDEARPSKQSEGVSFVQAENVPCIKALRIRFGGAQAQDSPDPRSEASASSQQRAGDIGVQQPWASAIGSQRPRRPRRDQFLELADLVTHRRSQRS